MRFQGPPIHVRLYSHCSRHGNLQLLDRGIDRQGRDLARTNGLNREVFDFLATAATKYGLCSGSGIRIQSISKMIGLITSVDSRTSNVRCLRMIAGSVDIVSIKAVIFSGLKCPRVMYSWYSWQNRRMVKGQ